MSTKPHNYVSLYYLYLTVLCNRSIQDGILLPSQKRSILVPVLKRSGLVSTDPLNFRPIVNVSFMSKSIEKIAAYQHCLFRNKQVASWEAVRANPVFWGFTVCL